MDRATGLALVTVQILLSGSIATYISHYFYGLLPLDHPSGVMSCSSSGEEKK